MSDLPKMLRFVLILRNVLSDGTFLLKDLPGSGKRIDVLCRSLAACFHWGTSSWPTSKLEVLALLSNDRCLTIKATAQKYQFGEKQWASQIQTALKGDSVEGIDVNNTSLNEIIKEHHKPPESVVLVLDEKGNSIGEIVEKRKASQYSFMLGNHEGFHSKDKELFENHNLVVVTLGDTIYLGSHCIAAVISHFEGITNAI